MSDKKAIIYYFTGTGNTQIAAEKTAAALSGYGFSVTLHQMTSRNKGIPDPSDFDVAGFAYPVHAFNSPRFFLRYVKRIPALSEEKKGMKAFLFKTSGEPFRFNNASSFALSRILKKKGFEPCVDMHMLMPYNIMFRYPDAMAKQMYLHTSKMSEKLADTVAADEMVPVKYNLLNVLLSYIFRVQWFGAKINGPLHTIKKDKCVKCFTCVRSCPADNIDIVDGYPKVQSNCIMCMNCTMSCPRAAIEPGFLRLWKVNPKWDYEKILADPDIPDNFTDNPDAGYFKVFRKYYADN